MCPLGHHLPCSFVNDQLSIRSISGVIAIEFDVLAICVHQHVLTLPPQGIDHIQVAAHLYLFGCLVGSVDVDVECDGVQHLLVIVVKVCSKIADWHLSSSTAETSVDVISIGHRSDRSLVFKFFTHNAI